METPAQPPLRPIPNPLLHILFPLLLCGGVVFLCYYPIQFIVVTASGPVVAQALAPPSYPNAILLTDRQFAQGNTGFVIQRYYYTVDSTEQVFLYMTEYMDRIELTEIIGEGSQYFAFREDKSWWGQQLAEISCSSLYCRTYEAYSYPRFNLYFYPAPDDSGGTHIEYEFTYPAP